MRCPGNTPRKVFRQVVVGHTATSFQSRKVDRRTFLCTGFAAAMSVAIQTPCLRSLFPSLATALSPARGGPEETTRLETLTQWLSASHETRRLALQSCLNRIQELDPSVHAWVQVSPQRPTGRGRLSEIPFGVKDIIETRGLATEYGSPIYKGRIGTADAAIVRAMRQRGGILLGKTHCTAFAYFTPPPTRNPRDLEHTPGGSSSGSAAAVAAGMVPLALGTQTKGSVLRPASFCGVTGFKPSYGLLPMEGVLPLAKSLDTLGFFTHTPADMLAFWESMGHSGGRIEDFALGAPEPVPEVEPAMAVAFRNSLSRLRSAGASIREIDITEMLAKLSDAVDTVTFYEGARFHQQRFHEYGSRLGAELVDLVQKGLRISVERYDEARRYIAASKTRMTELFKSTPVILSPAALGPAPLGLTSTGDPRMNAPWTALGTPAISIPMPVSKGLPLGLQLTGEHGQDARVIRTAVRLQRMLGNKAGTVSG
jgi:Asp-tRNA(Asn)/Glu-tRNA(Gln) amidotransferase A subunit family amidase